MMTNPKNLTPFPLFMAETHLDGGMGAPPARIMNSNHLRSKSLVAQSSHVW
jgi:hypothetical protein